MIANGLGPWWFPDAWRRWLTKLSSLFFDEASWRIHDESYDAADPARPVADFGFLKAMIRDASRVSADLPALSPTAKFKRLRSVLRKFPVTLAAIKVITCIGLAFFFYTLVRVFGLASYGRGKSDKE